MPDVDGHAPGAPCWFSLSTTDPAGARAFYARLFGWSYQVSGPELGHYANCQIDGRHVAGLGAAPPGSSDRPSWMVFLAVESVDETVSRLEAAGGALLMPAMDVPSAGRMGICVDAAGAHFGIWQPGEHRGAQLVGEPSAMAWQEVNTRKVDETRAFLREVFALESRPLGDMPNYFTLHLGGAPAPVGGILHMGEEFPPEIPPHWMPYFAVAGCDAASERCAAAGGKVCVPPFDTPYGRIAVLEDPQGAVFSVIERATVGT